MTLINGLDEADETVWEEWGVTKVQPWKGYSSCLDRLNGTTLEDLFTGFWRYSRGLQQNPRALLALEWYLESNAQEASHTSIILNQAALERLAVEMVGLRKEKEKEGDWIARALCKVTADIKIPQSLGVTLGKAKRLKHGPHALVVIRNDLIHEAMRHGVLSPEVYRQARELGL